MPPTFGGVIISNGDVGLPGREHEEDAVFYLGNNHGSLVEAGDKVYVFYHRHTHGMQYSRQDCAEEIAIDKGGTIHQAEITSQGLNGGPLDPVQEIPAYCCCRLRAKEGILHFSSRTPWNERHPRLMQEMPNGVPTSARLFIQNLRDGAEAGYKYLAFKGAEKLLEAEIRGDAEGVLVAHLDGPDGAVVAEVPVVPSDRWLRADAALLAPVSGTHALCFVFKGTGALDFNAFRFAE